MHIMIGLYTVIICIISAVTAGHDSHFNYSTPMVTGQLMESSFKALNIKLDSRSAALGIVNTLHSFIFDSVPY